MKTTMVNREKRKTTTAALELEGAPLVSFAYGVNFTPTSAAVSKTTGKHYETIRVTLTGPRLLDPDEILTGTWAAPAEGFGTGMLSYLPAELLRALLEVVKRPVR